MTGKWVVANPELARRIARSGHLLINHTYNHRSLTGFSTPDAALTPAQHVSELISTEQRLLKYAGGPGKPGSARPTVITTASSCATSRRPVSPTT